ncbi:MAG: hypothetical protein QOI91_602 [Solirubrobacteraceae bacterium]|jgi:hypothetical protein|nr:hypothetical protein [Solirubrobacteraceae bacterium]
MSIEIKIKLSEEDQALIIRADPHEWADAYKIALDNNSVIEIRNSDGRVLAIPANRILYWEEDPDPAGPDSTPVALHRQPA